MSTTAKIDFEPGLFDEVQPELATMKVTDGMKATYEAPSRSSGVRKVNNKPLFVAIGLIVMFIMVMGAVMMNRAEKQRMPVEQDSAEISTENTNALANGIIESESQQNNGLIPSSPPPAPIIAATPMRDEGVLSSIKRALAPSYGCDGSEIICITTTTAKPAESLQKLALVIPKAKIKRYRVQVAVVAADE